LHIREKKKLEKEISSLTSARFKRDNNGRD